MQGQDMPWHGASTMTKQAMAWHDMAWHVMAWSALAWRVSVSRHGMECNNQVMAWHTGLIAYCVFGTGLRPRPMPYEMRHGPGAPQVTYEAARHAYMTDLAESANTSKQFSAMENKILQCVYNKLNEDVQEKLESHYNLFKNAMSAGTCFFYVRSWR